MARYSYQPSRYRSRRRALAGRVADHYHPPTLPVAPARSEAGVVEHASEHVVGHRLGAEFTSCPGRAERFDQIHARTVPVL